MKSFVKLVIVIALVAGVVVEVGAPLWTRSAAAGAADDAASAGARELFQSNNTDEARSQAAAAAEFRGTKLTEFSIRPDGSVHVTVARKAKSYVLYHISSLKNWYNVTASATAVPH